MRGLNIQKDKSLKLENLLTLRKKMTQAEIHQEMIEIGKFIEENNLKKTGPIVTTTHNLEMINGEQVLDMEIMIPVDREFDKKDYYTFKPLFHLVHAVYARHEGNPIELQDTYNEIMKYLKENNLQQITCGYNVNVKEPVSKNDMDNMITDVYIGVNPSIL